MDECSGDTDIASVADIMLDWSGSDCVMLGFSDEINAGVLKKFGCKATS